MVWWVGEGGPHAQVLQEVELAQLSGHRASVSSHHLTTRRACFVQPHAGNEDWPWQTDIYFTDNDTVAYAVDEAVTITDTGMFYLWFVICDPNLAGVTISGQTSWKNPGGYLPGMMASYLPFFGCMSIAYMVAGLLWMLQYVNNWRDIMPLQNYITAVLALGMIEMATWCVSRISRIEPSIV